MLVRAHLLGLCAAGARAARCARGQLPGGRAPRALHAVVRGRLRPCARGAAAPLQPPAFILFAKEDPMTDMRRTLLWGVFLISLFLLYDAWNKHTGQPSLFAPTARPP